MAADLNVIFRQLYVMNRDELIQHTPLIGLTLIGTGEIWRVEYGCFIKSYKPYPMLPAIKGLMHAILGVHGVWELSLRGVDQDKSIKEIVRLKHTISSAIDVPMYNLPEQVASSAKHILDDLLKLSSSWVSGSSVTSEDFPSVMINVQRHLNSVIRFVGAEMFKSLNESFIEFKKESTDVEWNNCYIGICGPGQGRRDNIEIAAAAKVMGNKAIGEKILYIENANTLSDGLKCLSSIIVEKNLGAAAFNERYRMWRDLLSEPAINYFGCSFFPELGPNDWAE